MQEIQRHLNIAGRIFFVLLVLFIAGTSIQQFAQDNESSTKKYELKDPIGRVWLIDANKKAVTILIEKMGSVRMSDTVYFYNEQNQIISIQLYKVMHTQASGTFANVNGLKKDMVVYKNKVEVKKEENIKPETDLDYKQRGNAKYNKGDLDGAILDWDKAIELNPKYADAYYNRGIAKSDKGDLDGAILDYDKAIELNPKFALAYYNRGLAKKDKGDLDGSKKDIIRARELGFNNLHLTIPFEMGMLDKG